MLHEKRSAVPAPAAGTGAGERMTRFGIVFPVVQEDRGAGRSYAVPSPSSRLIRDSTAPSKRRRAANTAKAVQ